MDRHGKLASQAGGVKVVLCRDTYPFAEVEVDGVADAESTVAGVSGVAFACPLPLRPAFDGEAELAAGFDEEDTPAAPAREGVACGGAKVEEGEAGKGPGDETRDLRRVEEGREEEEETAVAGVTGAESWLLEEEGDSLRVSEKSSVCAVAADSLRLRRRPAAAPVAVFDGPCREEAPVPGSSVADAVVEAVLEASVEPEARFEG